jgi:hypothetical protein
MADGLQESEAGLSPFRLLWKALNVMQGRSVLLGWLSLGLVLMAMEPVAFQLKSQRGIHVEQAGI